jgi:hypothetical protein
MIFICLTRKEATDMHPEAQDQSSRPVQSITQPNPIMEANEWNGTEPATETGRTRARVVGATWPQEMIKTNEGKTLVLSLLSGYPHMAI